MTAFIDTNVLVRHPTGDPPEMAARASAFLASKRELLLTDLIAAETIYLLESFYEAPRASIAEAVRNRRRRSRRTRRGNASRSCVNIA